MMYFWDVESLKRDLSAGRVDERDSFLYLLCLGGATLAAGAVPLDAVNVWDQLDALVGAAGFLAGTAYIFRRNGGSGGSDFLTRYLSMCWVFGIRFTILVTIPTLVAVFVLEGLEFGDVSDGSTPIESAVLAVLEIAFYLRLGRHFSDLVDAGRGEPQPATGGG
ncbi:MAG: hypothetical protein PVF51_09935 [Nitrospirota bacterium]|jgi:hypothetical protein